MDVLEDTDMTTQARILHAAARGARIQWCNGKEWEPSPVYLDDEFFYRIHPDDEHLQYGPISTALREFAEKGKEPYTLSGLLALKAFLHECQYPFVLSSEWPHAQMLALILAEALADEGM